MTVKPRIAEDVGPGLHAQQIRNKRWRLYQGIYALVATALVVGLMMGTRDPAAGGPHFTPEAAVAGAVLLPLLTLVTIWFVLRLTDEVERCMIIDAWAAGLIVTIFGATSWLFLIGGGLVPTPQGPTALVVVMGGSGATVLVAAIWLRWRRFGDFGAV